MASVTQSCVNQAVLCRVCDSFYVISSGVATVRSCHHKSGNRTIRHRSKSCRPRHGLSVLSVGLLDMERRSFSATGQGSGESQPRSSFKEWTHYLIKFYQTFDVTAVTRAANSLNIELPKNFPNVRNLLANISLSHLQQSKTAEKSEPLKHGEGLGFDFHIWAKHKKDTGRTNSVENSNQVFVTQPKDTVVNRLILRSYGQKSLEREQDDFAGAMSRVQKSVESFNTSTADGPEAVKVLVKTDKSADDSKAQLIATSAGTQTSDNVFTTISSMATGFARSLAEYIPSGGEKTSAGSAISTVNTDFGKGLAATSKAVVSTQAEKVEKVSQVKRQLVARGSIDRQTRGLVLCLRDARSSTSQVVRLEELCRHFAQYPDCIGVAIKSKVLPCLLRLRESGDIGVADRAREALALVGYVDPVRGRGIRALCLDGGGTKGLVSIHIMKKIEEISQKPLHELFDYVCGVSTGALIGIMAAVFRVPVSEMEEIYKEFSVQMFERNRLVGAGKLFMSHAYYDTELWEQILRENIGEKSLLETARDPLCPKFSAVTTLINVARLQNFLFRNYNLSTTRQSHYPGSVNHHVWEAIRASSAAPGYYEECQLGDWVHQDGGLLTNNPTAIAIHECRLLWPGVPVQCIVSIGTGKYEPTQGPQLASKSSLKMKITKIVESATDTEAVHTVLHDLLPASSYYRFNPYMSEEFLLDEIRPEKWEQMKHDTDMYCRKNAQQIERSVQTLLQPKPKYARAIDWLRLRLDKIG